MQHGGAVKLAIAALVTDQHAGLDGAEVHEGRLRVLDVDGLPIRRHWLLVRMARRTSGPATRALWNFVSLTGAEYLPSLDGRDTTTIG